MPRALWVSAISQSLLIRVSLPRSNQSSTSAHWLCIHQSPMVSGYCGLHLAQIGSKSRAVQLLQGLEAQSPIATDNNRDLVPFPKASLTQTIGGQPDRQA